jgi:adenylylsulfate reductase subunit B
MKLDMGMMKAWNQEPEGCWECYSCVKICPQGAIEVRAYADIVPLGGSVVPLRGSDSIMWTVKFRNGKLKRFKFPIRTTPEGSINVYDGVPEPGDINDQLLITEAGKTLPKLA